MANVLTNIVTPFFKGRLGSVVFRHIGGKVFASVLPKPSDKPPSPAQLDTHQRFREAINYAKGVMVNPARRQIYESVAARTGKAVFTLAVGDFFRPPVIARLNLDTFRGNAGDKIIITALDDVGIASVDVVIRAGNGAVLEQGAAVTAIDFWSYTMTTALAAGQSVTIAVTAKDHAGNSVVKNQPYQKP